MHPSPAPGPSAARDKKPQNRYERYLALVSRLQNELCDGQEVFVEEMYLLMSIIDRRDPLIRPWMISRAKSDRILLRRGVYPVKYIVRHENIPAAIARAENQIRRLRLREKQNA